MNVLQIYPLLKKILFCFPPEHAHELTLKSLYYAEKLGLAHFFPASINKPCDVFGITFPNRLGLAAGLDKNGEYIDALAALGFGFIEVGSITLRPQPGNPAPRLFRLEKEEAIINRMGFNNKGVDFLIEKLKKTRYRGVLGINIGKNRDTPIEGAAEDYVTVFKKVAPFATYITINISSPNTENLRHLQHGELLSALLKTLKTAQADYFQQTKKYVPLLVKISPDLTPDELTQMTTIFLAEKIEGVIATNTTTSRDGVHSKESGGLSGSPLTVRANNILQQVSGQLKQQIPLIGCGGIMSTKDALEKVSLGATLIQIYTGLIYHGPALISDIVKII